MGAPGESLTFPFLVESCCSSLPRAWLPLQLWALWDGDDAPALQDNPLGKAQGACHPATLPRVVMLKGGDCKLGRKCGIAQPGEAWCG